MRQTTSIALAAPVRPTERSGNDVTADRWATHLRHLGHDVRVMAVDESAAEPTSDVAACLDAARVLIVLHARRGAGLARRFADRHPGRPLVVALTGTDLYLDLPGDAAAAATVEAADALIVLQRAALDRLARFDARWGAKAHVVHQSIDPALVPSRQPVADELRVVVLAHLRDVKDPLLVARAVRRLGPTSQVRVHHAGRALDAHWRGLAEAEDATNPRYRWYRELDRRGALALLASAGVLACTSVAEGGANVVTEAIAVGVPVVGTRIDGNTGLLGDDHPGLVPVGDDEAMAALLRRLEQDPAALDELQRRTDALGNLVDPATERSSLGALVSSLTVNGASA